MDRQMLHAIKLEVEKVGYNCIGPFHQSNSSLVAGTGDDFIVEVMPTEESNGFVHLKTNEVPHELVICGHVYLGTNTYRERFARCLDIRSPTSVDKLLKALDLILPLDGQPAPFQTTSDFALALHKVLQ